MDKNRKILAKMFSDFGSDAKQSIDYVRKAGFDFRYITSVGADGWFSVYEFGYKIEGKGKDQTVMIYK